MSRSIKGENVYAQLMRLYPPAFRERYGPELLTFYRQHRIDARFRGWRGTMRFWRHTVTDLLKTASTEWIATLSPRADYTRGAGEDNRRPSDFNSVATASGRSLPGTGPGLLMGFGRDLQLGLRLLRRRAGFSTLTVLILAFGIGGTAAAFSLVRGIVLESVPYPESDRLVTLDVIRVSTGFNVSLSNPNYEDWRDRNRVFSLFGGSASHSAVWTTNDGAEQLSGRMVIGEFFEILGLTPVEGRVFGPGESDRGAAALVVLGHGFWQRAFGGDPLVVGSSLALDDRSFTVAGVLGAGMGYPNGSVDVYVPMGVFAEELPWDRRESSFGTRAVALLRGGVSVEEAQADINRVTSEVDQIEGQSQVTATVRTIDDFLLGDVKQGIWLLVAAMLFLLLIAGANVANLAMSGAESRQAEIEVRRTLGAGSARVTRLLAAQWFWLAAIGWSAGVMIAHLAVRALPALLPMEIPPLVLGQIRVDGAVLAFAVVVTAGSAALFGLTPALRTTFSAERLRKGARSDYGREDRRFRDSLVVAQVGLSFILLVGSGLLLRSFSALASVDKGFDEDSVLTALVAVPDRTFSSHEEWMTFYDGIVGDLRASPDVLQAATTNLIPLRLGSVERRVQSQVGSVADEDQPSVLYNLVSEGYFETLGIPVHRGRVFGPMDSSDAAAVTVIDETLADHFWPGQDPIGRLVSFSADEGGPIWHTVIGVASNVRHYELESPSRSQVYVSTRQSLDSTGRNLRVVAKLAGDPAPIVQLLRVIVSERQPTAPISEVRMLQDYVEDALGSERALASLTTLLGGVAALLAGLGVFAVLSLAISRRSKEIALRIAVGATNRSVVTMVAKRGLGMIALGIAFGVGLTASLTRLLDAVLYQVSPTDPVVYLSTAMILVSVGVVSMVGPSLRAVALTPRQVLND